MIRLRARAAQRGTVLMIVLVAMLAMMVSVIALSRSTDTNLLVAGNLAFRNASVHSSDAGILGAVQWLQSTAATPTLDDSVPDRGYYASVIEPNWDDPALSAICPPAKSPAMRPATPCSGWSTACARRPAIRTIRACRARR